MFLRLFDLICAKWLKSQRQCGISQRSINNKVLMIYLHENVFVIYGNTRNESISFNIYIYIYVRIYTNILYSFIEILIFFHQACISVFCFSNHTGMSLVISLATKCLQTKFFETLCRRLHFVSLISLPMPIKVVMCID